MTKPKKTYTAEALDQKRYALARQVPDMAHGFTIVTAFGSISIPAGATSKRIGAMVDKMIRAELAAADFEAAP
jgi:hypothetical protein